MSQDATKKASQVVSGMNRKQVWLRNVIVAPIRAISARPSPTMGSESAR
jgi:hypothetical protein